MADGDIERRHRSRPSGAAGIAAALFTAAVFGVIVWLHAVEPDSVAIPVVTGVAAVIALVALGTGAIASLRAAGQLPYMRPARFVVADGGFLVPALVDQRRGAIGMLLLTGPMLGNQWALLSGQETAAGVLLAVLAVILVGGTTFGWFVGDRPLIRLTATGVRWDARIFRRDIPWEALATGSPPRPLPADTRLVLAVARPDLVSQAGFGLGAGRPDAPVVSLQLRVHPPFLADAIRWYAEHPEHRAAIGTEAEHERLLAALTGANG